MKNINANPFQTPSHVQTRLSQAGSIMEVPDFAAFIPHIHLIPSCATSSPQTKPDRAAWLQVWPSGEPPPHRLSLQKKGEAGPAECPSSDAWRFLWVHRPAGQTQITEGRLGL